MKDSRKPLQGTSKERDDGLGGHWLMLYTGHRFYVNYPLYLSDTLLEKLLLSPLSG